MNTVNEPPRNGGTDRLLVRYYVWTFTILAMIALAILWFSLEQPSVWPIVSSSGFRNIMLTILGGISFPLLLARSYFLARTDRREQEGQITERLNAATNLLSNDASEVRIGAIHALRRVYDDGYERDKRAVLATLQAFIRSPRRLAFTKEAKEPESTEAGGTSPGESGDTGPPLPDDTLYALRFLLSVHRNNDSFEIDLNHAYLPGADLSNQDMNEPDFSCSKLRHASFEGTDTNLRNASFFKADLCCATFNGATLIRPNFQESPLKGVNFTKARLDTDRNEDNILAADFSGAKLSDATFEGTQARGAVFERVTGDEVDFSGANLETAVFDNAVLGSGRWNEAILTRVRMDNGQFADSEFNKTQFTGTRAVRSTFEASKFARAVFDRCSVFSHADFSRAEFEECRISGDFDSAVLHGASFFGCTFSNCDFTEAKLDQSIFKKTDMICVKFGGASLVGVKLTHCQLDDVTFAGANLAGATFENMKATNCNFSRAYSGLDVTSPLEISKATLIGATFVDAAHPNIRITDSDLQGARFDKGNFDGSRFSDVNFEGASFVDASVRDARMLVRLVSADLAGADLSGSDLSSAYLENTALSGAQLVGADLSNAFLGGAILAGANLSGAELSGAFVTKEQLETALNVPHEAWNEVSDPADFAVC